MERIPLHSWEMEFSIQYHVTINSQLNDQNSISKTLINSHQNLNGQTRARVASLKWKHEFRSQTKNSASSFTEQYRQHSRHNYQKSSSASRGHRDTLTASF